MQSFVKYLPDIETFCSVVGASKTFPRSQSERVMCEPGSPVPRWRRDDLPLAWSSTQHFHLPPGTRPRHASSRGALSVASTATAPHSRASRRPASPSRSTAPAANNLRRPVEPRLATQHFHLPAAKPGRLTYSRPGSRSGMTQLVRAVAVAGSRQEVHSGEEPRQFAQFPGGLPARHRPANGEELSSSEKERKRRLSGSMGSDDDEEGDDEERYDEDQEETEEVLDAAFEAKLR